MRTRANIYFNLVICAISRIFEGSGVETILAYAQEEMPDRLTMLELQTRSPAQSSQFVSTFLEIPSLPEEFTEEIIKRSDGFPLFMEEKD